MKIQFHKKEATPDNYGDYYDIQSNNKQLNDTKVCDIKELPQDITEQITYGNNAQESYGYYISIENNIRNTSSYNLDASSPGDNKKLIFGRSGVYNYT
jgi:hypothetical protein